MEKTPNTTFDKMRAAIMKNTPKPKTLLDDENQKKLIREICELGAHHLRKLTEYGHDGKIAIASAVRYGVRDAFTGFLNENREAVIQAIAENGKPNHD